MAGKVYLVGAGPGDPGLLTLRGAELIGRAEVLVYDHLAAPELLSLAPVDCELINAGKEASQHTLSQTAINELLAKKALAGRQVVRLKGGDPYIFGRGGEEALYLADLGVEFEVVPGVSAALAAASYAGVPLTHRGLATKATILTGHDKSGRTVSFPGYDPAETLAIVMGRGNLEPLCEGLKATGRPDDTPALAVEWGTTPWQKSVAGTIATLPARVTEARIGAPVLLVIGQVVSLREKLNWFEKRPLFGRTVLVTRTRAQGSLLAARLKELGAKVLEKPVISIKPLDPNPDLDQVLSQLKSFSPGYLILTSPNGAEIFLKALLKTGQDVRSLGQLKIVVMGEGTAAALSPFGLKADYLPKVYQAEGLLDLFNDLNLPLDPVIIPRAKVARDVLPDGLAARGHQVKVVPLYATVLAPPGSLAQELQGERIDLATVTSSSVAMGLARGLARGLAAGLEGDKRPWPPVVAIGPIAGQKAMDLGFSVVAQSPQATINSLVMTIKEWFKRAV
ncbi:MAG: uroporphyrinogen-III C-methyltransferase [Deltaproteobacteria bacterium]|jgi:uroporphyrinogen III methyltransferase/synthase|nr:uroporphyrinogen-III C-methyltransferase [Deltaproteobacteria bacterium]